MVYERVLQIFGDTLPVILQPLDDVAGTKNQEKRLDIYRALLKIIFFDMELAT